ncbi:hypothetical protein FGO68_gene6316 [Halteria grandinella]|uniref:EamA domain-containing protein n=1 Tax=Halteria grandinella TaxID=5974 RepID=A0A8J8NLD8_HALGN|nr:hypothetical protein FGO68_gene6316 [Halteria grandinella]
MLDIPREGDAKTWVFCRAIFGFFSFSFSFISIYLMPLSIAMVLYFTQPISAAVVNFLLGNERLALLEIISIFSAMVGVVILTNPSTIIPQQYLAQQVTVADKDNTEYPFYNYGIVSALMGSVFSGFAYFSMRRLGTRVNPTINTFYFATSSCVLSFITFSVVPGQRIFSQIDWESVGLLILTGLLGWIAQEGVAKALQTEKAGRAASLNYLQVVIAFLADTIFFKRESSWTDYLGSTLILLFTLINSLRKCF